MYQLAPDAVCSLEGAGVQEVVIAPVLGLAILLVCVVHIEKRQMVPCSNKKMLRCKHPVLHCCHPAILQGMQMPEHDLDEMQVLLLDTGPTAMRRRSHQVLQRRRRQPEHMLDRPSAGICACRDSQECRES